MQPIVWTIAGFSPSAGAGIIADCHTLSALNVTPKAITTALTAQNGFEVTHCVAVSPELLEAQFFSLRKLGWPKAIKIGLLPDVQSIHCLSHLLKDFKGDLVYDPVMNSSSGYPLMDPLAIEVIRGKWLPNMSVITPNLSEAQHLTGMSIHCAKDMLAVAKALIHMGAKQVILKGGHLPGVLAQDLWTNGSRTCWLNSARIHQSKTHGTGCVFSASLAASLAHGYDVLDAFVLAKMAVTQSIRSAMNKLSQWPSSSCDLPWLTYSPNEMLGEPFPVCEKPIGFYPIVDNAQWIKKLKAWHVPSAQLRVKNKPLWELQSQIKQAVDDSSNLQLFINDHWELAIENRAYGVHLGQEDLDNCDLSALRGAGIRLGISTHSYAELARAHALQPSYVALGPIYQTKTKPMRFAAQGLTNLQRWRELVSTQLVAIGGITLANVKEIIAYGADGVSVISALTKATDPQLACQQFLSHFKNL